MSKSDFFCAWYAILIYKEKYHGIDILLDSYVHIHQFLSPYKIWSKLSHVKSPVANSVPMPGKMFLLQLKAFQNPCTPVNPI